MKPTPADRFTFGLWTVGWQARDPFGDATRPALDPVEAVHRLAELGAYGVTFHDDDLIPFGSDDRRARRAHRPVPQGARRDRPGRADGDHEPVHPPGVQGRRASPATTARSAGTRCARSCATSTWPPSWARRPTCCGAAARAPSPTPPRTSGPRSTATARASTPSPQYVDRPRLRPPLRARAQAERAARRHPAADHRARAGLHLRRSSTPTWSGSTPRSATSRWPGSTSSHGIAQALWQGKLFHIDLNGQRGIKYDQDLVFGHGDLLNAFSLVDLLENGGPDGGPAYDGPRHFDYKPLRTEDIDGVWASAAANMRTYLLLKERARGLPRRPRGAGGAGRQPGGRAARRPPWATGETYDGPARRPLGVRGLRRRRGGAARLRLRPLNQLAVEHLLGAALTWLPWSPGSTPRPSRARSSSATRETGALVRAGRARRTRTAPRSTRTPGGRRSSAAVAQAGGLDDVAAVAVGGQQHGMVCLDDARRRSCARRCCGTTPARAGAAADLIAELRRRRRRGPRRSAACRSPRSP